MSIGITNTTLFTIIIFSHQMESRFHSQTFIEASLILWQSSKLCESTLMVYLYDSSKFLARFITLKLTESGGNRGSHKAFGFDTLKLVSIAEAWKWLQ